MARAIAAPLIVDPKSLSEPSNESLVIGEKRRKKLVRFSYKSLKLWEIHPKNQYQEISVKRYEAGEVAR